MGSAQLDTLPFEEQELFGPVDLKQQVAERLAAHRERRRGGRTAEETPAEPIALQPGLSGAGAMRPSEIAAAVAERFAQSPSYRAVLAEQAQRAIDEASREAQQAAADAEIAARSAQAIAHTQQKLIDELELWDAPQDFNMATAHVVEEPARRGVDAAEEKPRRARRWKALAEPSQEVETSGITVRLYEDLGRSPSSAASSTNAPLASLDRDEALALDEEIAFRQAPVFEPFVIEPTTPLPANLLEFPRQLVAARKARPRFAEGPLREESEPRSPQLRIFEVEPEQISTVAEPLSVTPEWANIRLDAHTATEPSLDAKALAPAILASMLPPQTASLSLRVMAACVDAAAVAAGFFAFAAVAARVANLVPTGALAAGTAAGTLAIFYLLYQLLFFSFSDQTPGMRYARIGLCTFTDENPSRAAMRRRVLAQLVAVWPMGIGLLWAMLDDNGLGWHDRISRMYQRAY